MFYYSGGFFYIETLTKGAYDDDDDDDDDVIMSFFSLNQYIMELKQDINFGMLLVRIDQELHNWGAEKSDGVGTVPIAVAAGNECLDLLNITS